jgi:hypothetical protein
LAVVDLVNVRTLELTLINKIHTDTFFRIGFVAGFPNATHLHLVLSCYFEALAPNYSGGDTVYSQPAPVIEIL